MDKDVEGSSCDLIVGDIWHLSGGTTETNKTLDQDCCSTGQESSLGPPVYEARMLPTWLQNLVSFC